MGQNAYIQSEIFDGMGRFLTSSIQQNGGKM